MEEKYNLYDKIVAATYVNIEVQSPADIYIKYNPNSYAHKVFLKVSLLVANFTNKKIYIKCKMVDFFKILLYYYPIKDLFINKCRFRFTKKERQPWLLVDETAAFEAKSFNTDIKVFEDIWKEYYQK